MAQLSKLKEKLKLIPESGVTIYTPMSHFQLKSKFTNGHLIGVEVDNLRNAKFMPFDVFTAVISLLNLSPGHFATNGETRNSKLGSDGLPFNSIEGHVARIVYEKKEGISILRRITPIAGILVWAEICERIPQKGSEQGGLKLISDTV